MTETVTIPKLVYNDLQTLARHAKKREEDIQRLLRVVEKWHTSHNGSEDIRTYWEKKCDVCAVVASVK